MSANFIQAATRFAVCCGAIVCVLVLLVFSRERVFAQTQAKQPAASANDPLDDVLAPAATGTANNAGAADKGVAKSPMVRALLKVMEELGTEQGTEEERRLVKEQLMRADEELSTSLGDNSRRKIMQANQRLHAFRIPTRDRVALPPPRPKLAPGAGGRSGMSENPLPAPVK
jgi:hypothetical protein